MAQNIRKICETKLGNLERFSHLPELQPNLKLFRRIVARIKYSDSKLMFERIYRAAAASVTKRNTEIERLQREIYNMLPHDEAAAIINDCDMWVGRPVLRDKENVKLKQALDAARKVRDGLVAQKRNEFVVDWAYRIVSAQGAVNQAKKALYIHLQKTGKSRYSHQNIKHRDL